LSFKSLSVALKTQRLIKRPLGRILIDTGEAEENTVLTALSEQLHLEIVDFDAAMLPARIGLLLPSQLMHDHRVFPVAVSDAGEVVVASYRQLDEKGIRMICDHVSMPVKICLARRGEVDTRFLSASDDSLGELAARLRRGTRKRLAARKPVNERGLGDYLVAEGYLDRDTLTLCVQKAANRGQSLGAYLVNQGFLTHEVIESVINRMRRIRGIRLVSVGGQQLAGAEAFLDLDPVGDDGQDNARGAS